jgi:hypothetical protein
LVRSLCQRRLLSRTEADSSNLKKLAEPRRYRQRTFELGYIGYLRDNRRGDISRSCPSPGQALYNDTQACGNREEDQYTRRLVPLNTDQAAAKSDQRSGRDARQLVPRTRTTYQHESLAFQAPLIIVASLAIPLRFSKLESAGT